MPEHENKGSLITSLSNRYGDQAWLKAVIQLIPYIGGSLDTLISARGQELRKERLEHYLTEFAQKIIGLESKFEDLVSKAGEETYDLIRTHFEHVDRSRSESKRKRFANILLNQVERKATWDEPDTATRLLSGFTDSHIAILKSICMAPICPAPFDGLRVSIIEHADLKDSGNIKFNILADEFKDIPGPHLKLLVIELLSSGLIKDEGVGRWGGVAMEKFSPLPTGDWFLSWIERGV